MKKISTITCAIVVLATFTFLSCQKDDVLKPEKQVVRPTPTSTDTLSKSSASDKPPGPSNSDKQTLGIIGDLKMFCSTLDSVHIRKVGDYYNVDITMRRLSPEPDFSKDEGYSIEIWDYSVKADFIFFLLWHENHALTASIPPNQKVSTRVHVNNFFAAKGFYRRELIIYLSRKFNGTRYYKSMHVVDYHNGSKNQFNNYFFKPTAWSSDYFCS
ncbi:MAG: hypothetical protein ACQPRJ_00640 [Solitalea-like symbiont of Acarus siro]